MNVNLAVCHSCGLHQEPVETYLDCDGEPLRDPLRECRSCGSWNLRFIESEPGSSCDACGDEDGFRDASICSCGKSLCPRCYETHQRYPVLCAGRRIA